MRNSITYITGGERSGKSSYGQNLALEKSDSPIYLATSQVLDEDFEKRVDRHKSNRDERWLTIEEPINISKHDLTNKVVLLDCITLWLTNIYYSYDTCMEQSFDFARKEWNRFSEQNFELIVISNELGMGVHGTTHEIRKFVELQGWMNQHIAKLADEAWLMVSGIPMKLK